MSSHIPKVRHSDYPIHPLILGRWSPRAMSGEGMTDQELFPLFEAARWAPSSYNNQPWRFLYAKRDSDHFEKFLDFLVETNKVWCVNAAVLVVVASHMTFERNGKPSRTHSYDTGAAWQNLALQGTNNGFVVHGMEGFDFEKARKILHVPDNYQVEAMAAIGKKAPPATLPPELEKREIPSQRKPIKEFALEGGFK